MGRIGAYLHTSAPITVRFWRGKVFQIVTNDGNVYLDYTMPQAGSAVFS